MQPSVQKIRKSVKIECARLNFLDFVNYIKPTYQANWHHQLLCNYLQKFIEGEILKLMIFMPPQHGKSELVSRALPAYLLGLDPELKIVLASYSKLLASSFNRDCQRYMDSEEYEELFPDTFLSRTKFISAAGTWLRNSDVFETVGYGGFLKTVGVGGSLTGTTADFTIIDDPVKGSMEARSPTRQNNNWDWFNEVLSTRLHNNSSMLITQTRWDENDLSGMILQKQKDLNLDEWVILNLPAIKENNDNPEDPREIGEALWETKHSKERLMRIQKQSNRTFQSLYQQNPQPTQAGGEFYDMFSVAKNVIKTEYDKSLALHLTFDFNSRPAMHAGVWQIKNVNGIKTAHKIKEFKASKTIGICNEFKRWMPTHASGLCIYGDPAGNNEDTRTTAGYNDYRMIVNELGAYHPALRVSKTYPSVAGRGDFINTIFNFGIKNLQLYIGDNCPMSINDYLYIKQDSDRNKLKSKVMDKDTGKSVEKYGHLSDADDYFICYAFASEYEKYQGIVTYTYQVVKPPDRRVW